MKYLNGISVLYNKNLVTDIRTALRSKRFAMMEKRVENSINAREFMWTKKYSFSSQYILSA